MARVVVSTVGMSTLLNSVTQELRRKLNENANKDSANFPNELLEEVIKLEDDLKSELSKLPISDLRKRSAELNGLLGFYKDKFNDISKADIHFLICTDTLLGETAGNIIQTFLKSHFVSVSIEMPKGLSTENRLHFDSGIKELLTWCDNILHGYRKSGYEIIFNLTGSFKSLQGYLNTFGMFYADKIIYIFETGNELIEIPKLPISIDENLIRKKANIIAQMVNDIFFSKNIIVEIPNIMIEELDENNFGLSTWGQLAWNTTKEKILAEKLLDLPLIEYADTFKKDFQQTVSSSDKVILQETIVKVSSLLQQNNGDISCLKAGRGGGLLYDNYVGTNKHLGHFRINQGDRVSCQTNNGKLVLRHFGAHDYVNDNP